MIINPNSQYTIITENETTAVLSHFDHDFIMEIMKEQQLNRISNNSPNIVNLVGSIESNFRTIMSNTADDPEIAKKREDTYKDIIDMICQFNGMTFNYDAEYIDYFSNAFYLYDFFVSNFRNYLIAFFTNFIIKEKNMLYEMLNLQEFRKNKDVTTAYGKIVYSNSKLAVITANIDYIITNLATFEIDFNNILTYVYSDKNVVRNFMENITPNVDFFKTAYIGSLNNSYKRQSIITDIKLTLHNTIVNNSNS